MLDSDVAMLYHYKTKEINKTVKRNIERFPESFCFQLTENELENLRSQFATTSLEEKMWFKFGTTYTDVNDNLRFQIGTSSLENEKWSQSATTLERENYGGRRYLPYVFTEQGIAMLSGLLRN